ncbi:hypothetical protein BDF20DRAFT_820450 [Mycotypha africana]|uniref:uncharacterized protein n=1 Tax=Mycotypha africana TaxID=64632 RepID=UPI002300ACFF|nr:uncharacterized protein BDF20DRAFT_820450 [Mycotypha africana]KAI8977616.1 hypothetical protein BDF20DRAFT_820450 [Mycotypha africana]
MNDVPSPATGIASTSTTPARRNNSLLKKTKRRSTILSRSANQSEPIVENPNNSPQINEQLKNEYETVRAMNRVLEISLKHFEEASERIHQFSETINRTDHLLDLWLSVLEKTEEIRSYVENSNIPANKVS